MDLYKILGVSREATTEEIKKEYRKIMHNIHPDKNNGERHPEHDQIVRAYKVLTDPARRQLYDDTGFSGDAMDTEKLAQMKVVETLMDIIQQSPPEIEQIDIETSLEQTLINGRQVHQDEYEDAEILIAKLNTTIDRSAATGGKASFILDALKFSTTAARASQINTEQKIEVYDRALEIKDDYHFDTKPTSRW